MDSYRSYAAAHPRNRRGQFKRKNQSTPEIEIEALAATIPRVQSASLQGVLEAIHPDTEVDLITQKGPDAEGYAGWSSGLWRGTSLIARAAGEQNERNTLYLELGAPGVNPFEIFDRLTELGERSQYPQPPWIQRAGHVV